MKQLFRSVIIIMLLVCVGICASAQRLMSPIKIDNQNPLNCYDKYVTMFVPNGTTELSIDNLAYFSWYYGVVNPLNDLDTTYRFLGVSVDSSFSFIPRLIFNINGTNEITKQTFVHIKVELRTNSYIYKGSSATPLMFSPSSPGLAAPSIITTPSCVNSATGTLKIALSKVTDSVLYIVRYGANTNYCNPQTNNPPCFNVVRSGYTTVDTFTIYDVPAGDFTVILANQGLETGICNNVYSVTVPYIPPVQIDSSKAVNNSCFQSNDGKIEMNVSSGDSTSYHFRIIPASGSFSYANHKAVFSDLPAGQYWVSVWDTCNVEVRDSFMISQPPRVIGNVIKVQPTCQSPANGILKITAGYNFDNDAFSSFNYYIYRDSLLVDSLINTLDTLFVVDSLLGGNYRVVVVSPNTPGCPGIDESFYLPDNRLSITIVEKRNVTCNADTDGRIMISGTGGSGMYRYFLRKLNDINFIEDTAGLFENLAGGLYEALIINEGSGCNDSGQLVINVIEPDTIQVVVTATDVQCFNAANGQLIAIGYGGNGDYSYLWERKLNDSSWSTYPVTGDTIGNLLPGTYRAKATDAKGCFGYSPAAFIIQPDSLVIDSVIIKDIACFNEFGHIEIYSSGGNSAHIQQIRRVTDSTFSDFTAISDLDTGKYLIRIVDAKGCITNWKDTIVITSPPEPLDFSYVQATVNGYNILCFGADDGVITLTAQGGNGFQYSGYTYTFDGHPWQSSNTLSNIPAGLRDIKVRDARGCITTKQILFTQPDDSLNTELIAKFDVVCFGATTGKITVAAAGGVVPYKFSKDGGISYQSSPIFDNLAAGVYNIVIKDQNNCSGLMTVSVNHLFNELISSAVITNVSCNGGSNGAIDAAISGGEAPFNYQWTSSAQTGGVRNSLPANNYQLTVTDNKGCIKSFTYAVTQPTALQPLITAAPVCYGSTTSFIKVSPLGTGSSPYLYSKDSGATWQTDSVLNGLTVGNYKIMVKDNNNCIFGNSVSMLAGTVNPNLNFIVSSSQHVFDTITMKEISLVKPDSIRWVFDIAAQIVDPNVNEPKIRFATVDTGAGYRIRLIGYYAHCIFQRDKYLKILPFDPNAVANGSGYNRGIRLAELFPNPNNGNFTLNVEFYKIQRATVYISQLSGTPVSAPIVFPPSLQITRNITGLMNGQSAGTYLLKIISDYDTRYILFVKQ